MDYAENNSVTLRSGFPSYYISIDRRNDANTVKLLDELNEALLELNSGPLSKANVIIELSFDASLHIRRAINLVQGNLLLGLLLATLILYCFLRNFR
ncbi:MAG: efflux RND transporter permease subunit, partial [Pseudomonadales bacterium]